MPLKDSEDSEAHKNLCANRFKKFYGKLINNFERCERKKEKEAAVAGISSERRKRDAVDAEDAEFEYSLFSGMIQKYQSTVNNSNHTARNTHTLLGERTTKS